MSLNVRKLATVLSTSLCLACARSASPVERRTDDWSRIVGAGNEPVSLHVVPVKDTVSDREEVRIVYIVSNRGAPVDIAVNDHFLAFQVLGPDGRVLSRLSDAPLAETNLPARRVTIESSSFAGGVVNLACASRLDSPGRTSTRPCLWRYDFTGDGTYKVIGYYTPLAPPDDTSGHTLRLRSDTATIVIRAANN